MEIRDCLHWKYTLSWRLTLIIASLALIGASSLLSLWTSFISFPLFCIVLIFLVYLPGRCLIDCSSIHLPPLDHLMLSLTIGMVSGSLIYAICTILHLRQLFLAWPILLMIVWRARQKDALSARRSHDVTIDASHLLLVIIILLCLFPLLIIPFFFPDMSISQQGTMTASAFEDLVLHMSVSQELSHTFPPQIPFLSGFPLSYHYGQEFLAVLFHTFGGGSIPDLMARFLPALFLSMTVLAIFCCARLWLKSSYLAVLTAFLVVWGEDLSYIPGILSKNQYFWTAAFFPMPTIFSFYFHNPILPAMPVFFSALYCLLKYHRDEKPAWFAFTSILFSLLMLYKFFFSVQAFIALVLTGIWFGALKRDFRLVKVSVLMALICFPLYVFISGSNKTIMVALNSPTVLIHQTAAVFGSAFSRSINTALQEQTMNSTTIIVLTLCALPIFLIGSFGMRSFAFPQITKILIHPRPADIARCFLAIFVLIGLPVTFITKLTPIDYPNSYNNMVWFYVQSKHAAWLLAIESVQHFVVKKSLIKRVLLICLVIGMSIPSSLQFLGVITNPNSFQKAPTVKQSQVSILNFFQQHCQHGEVVLMNDVITGLLTISMTSCRIPFADIYAKSFVSRAEREERAHDVQKFWQSLHTEKNIETDILKKYQVNYLVLDKNTMNTALSKERIARQIPDGHVVFDMNNFIIFNFRR